jgi:hypothetical protein
MYETPKLRKALRGTEVVFVVLSHALIDLTLAQSTLGPQESGEFGVSHFNHSLRLLLGYEVVNVYADRFWSTLGLVTVHLPMDSGGCSVTAT